MKDRRWIKDLQMGISKNCNFDIATCEKPPLRKDLHSVADIKRWGFRCAQVIFSDGQLSLLSFTAVLLYQKTKRKGL